ncbi:hypothetical protein MNBD_PLANCTO02-1952 [hydrothermal vent metagenome]|uniref:HTH araC/xylS-type domain-containing protein n=1 Tax=hydrothermal vent metagenome TaxID=652676 RepID=A0A3B1E000_9ZZZZ
MAKKIILQNQLIRTVSLIVTPDDSWGRGVIRGAVDFANNHAHWRLRIFPPENIRHLNKQTDWLGDGVVALIGSSAMAEKLLAFGIPVVDLDTVVLERTGKLFGHVITNDFQRAQFALDHFQEKGILNFAGYAPPSQRYSHVRMNIFQKKVEKEGLHCDMFQYKSRRHWWKLRVEEQQEFILPWLKSLPERTGVFTPDAHQARQLSETCQFNDVRIPEQIAIIAGDMDELLCSVSQPPLTSILLASQQHGFEAVQLLQRMMEGNAAPKNPIQINPLRVIPRASTDVLYLDDPLIVQAIYYIRNHACKGIDVSDVLKEVPISRRAMELKFKQLIGHTPAQEIKRVKLDKAKEMLIETKSSVDLISRVCGFSNATQFCVIFRKQFDETPLSFRKRNDLRSELKTSFD